VSESRLSYRFGPLERRGILGPVRGGQAVVLGAGALLAIGVLDQAPTATGALGATVLFAFACGLALAPVGSRTVQEWGPVAFSFAARLLGGRVQFRSPVPTAGRRWRLRGDGRACSSGRTPRCRRRFAA
jgi:hypothetical protein